MDENKALAEDIGRLQDDIFYRGKAYQQLVINRDGKAQWEDQLAYDGRIEISWDGDTTGRAFINGDVNRIYKVSDLTPTIEELIGGTFISFESGKRVKITQNIIHEFGDTFIVGNEEIIVVSIDDFEINGYIFPEKGIYMCYTNSAYTNSLIYGKIKQLDAKFLPILPNLNVIFTCHNFNEPGVHPQYTCNVEYSQLRDWYDRGLPIFAICKVIRYNEIYETLIMSSYELNNSNRIMVFSCSGQKSGTLQLAYHENGVVTKYEPS